jgi:hypothetical protein
VPDEPDLAGLEAQRARLYADLSQVGDFRRGALNGCAANAASRTAPARSPVIRATGRSTT